MLELMRVSAGYKRGAPVLREVSLRVVPGKVRALVGANGVGKTTLLRLALGMLAPWSGRVSLFGRNPLLSTSRFAGRVGMVLDGRRRLEPRWTGWENIEYHGARLGLSPRQYRDWGFHLLERFGLPEHHVVNRYSRGMRQRLRLVIAFLPRPELLLLDEPTLGLDVVGQRVLMQILEEERRAGRALLITSQSLNFLERIADTFTVLRAGRVLAEGSLEAIAETMGQNLRLRLVLAHPERLNGSLPQGWEKDEMGGLLGPMEAGSLASVLELVAARQAGLLDIERESPLERGVLEEQ